MAIKRVLLVLVLASGVASAEPDSVVTADLGLHVVGAGYQRSRSVPPPCQWHAAGAYRPC